MRCDERDGGFSGSVGRILGTFAVLVLISYFCWFWRWKGEERRGGEDCYDYDL